MVEDPDGPIKFEGTRWSMAPTVLTPAEKLTGLHGAVQGAGMKWSVRVLGNRQLNAQLDRFAREARERQKLAAVWAATVRTLARQNIKRQRTVGGTAMTPAQKRPRGPPHAHGPAPPDGCTRPPKVTRA